MGARISGEQGSPRDMTTLPDQRNTAGRMRNSNNTRAGPWSLAYPRKKWHGKMATYSLYIRILHRERGWYQAPCPDRDEAKTIPTTTLQWASCEARTISSPCPRSMPASTTWWLTVPPCLRSSAPVGDGRRMRLPGPGARAVSMMSRSPSSAIGRPPSPIKAWIRQDGLQVSSAVRSGSGASIGCWDIHHPGAVL